MVLKAPKAGCQSRPPIAELAGKPAAARIHKTA